MNRNLIKTGGKATMAIAAVLVLLPLSAVAGSVLDAGYGSTDNFISAEISGMGGTGSALYRGGFSAFLNPAMLSRAEDMRLDAGMSLSQDHEDRFQPLFDSFESYVTDMAIASNRNHYLDNGFALAAGITDGIGYGVSWTRRYDFSYDFEETLLDPDSFASVRDQVIQERRIGVDGALNEISLGIGATDSDNRFSFGIALQYVYGKIESTLAQEYFDEPENSIMMTSSTEMDGFATTAGMAYRFNERLDLAATFNSGLHVQGDQNSVLYSEMVDPIVASDVEESIRYPRNYSLGLAYYPRSELKTVFTMEAVFSEWSELEDDSMDAGPFLEDTIDFRVGVQHTFYNGVPLRFGFRHRDSYSDPEASVSYFTSGVGVPYGGGIISASVELSKASSYQEHWFEYPNTDDFPVDPISRVEETRFRLGVGYRYMF